MKEVHGRQRYNHIVCDKISYLPVVVAVDHSAVNEIVELLAVDGLDVHNRIHHCLDGHRSLLALACSRQCSAGRAALGREGHILQRAISPLLNARGTSLAVARE